MVTPATLSGATTEPEIEVVAVRTVLVVMVGFAVAVALSYCFIFPSACQTTTEVCPNDNDRSLVQDSESNSSRRGEGI